MPIINLLFGNEQLANLNDNEKELLTVWYKLKKQQQDNLLAMIKSFINE